MLAVYHCPRCQSRVSLPETGEKVFCPECGQKLRTLPPVGKTVLVLPDREPVEEALPVVSARSPLPTRRNDYDDRDDRPRQRRRRGCP
jgi:DNA-directed RNA polymerase subunit RPC12/RpoP